MRLIRVATLSIGFVFAFTAVAIGQHGNWFETIAASPKPAFREYNATGVRLKCGKPSLLIAPLSLTSPATGLSAEARETQSRKSAVPEMQPMLQLGILQAAGQASVKNWSMAKNSADTTRAVRKSWISVGPGSLPLATTIQPDATQRYGADPAILQVYFGHRR
jgi:hypothetical protein